jgi:hypothetical protein
MKRTLATKSVATSPTLVKASTAKILTKYERQELYINKVDTFVKVKAERDKRVKYMAQESYNGGALYGIDSLLQSSSNFSAVRDFLGELSAAGVIRRGIAYSSIKGIDALNKFNASSIHTSALTKINFTVSESEPWVATSGVSWANFFALIEYAQNMANAAGIEHRTYQGWPNKPSDTARALNVYYTILGAEVPMLHIYNFDAPQYARVRARLIEFAKQAFNLGFTPLKKLTVMSIFSGEQEFSFDYFKTHSPVEAMDQILKEFNADNFPNKNLLDFSKGFITFKYSDMLGARPLK